MEQNNSGTHRLKQKKRIFLFVGPERPGAGVKGYLPCTFGLVPSLAELQPHFTGVGRHGGPSRRRIAPDYGWRPAANQIGHGWSPGLSWLNHLCNIAWTSRPCKQRWWFSSSIKGTRGSVANMRDSTVAALKGLSLGA